MNSTLLTISILIAFFTIIDMYTVKEDANFVYQCQTCGKRWAGPVAVVIIKSMIHDVTGCGLGTN